MNTHLVDLRSDTVTKPTSTMRKAMADAEVGDDLYGEDPTVAALERLYADLVGKDAGLFVPSGVMANQIALRTHTKPGSWVAAGSYQHVVVYEYGGSARNAGVQFYLLDDQDGSFDADQIEKVKSTQGYWDVTLSLICVENTHMPSGGRVWDLERLARVRAAAGTTPIHMDGARLFNAAVASNKTAAEIASYADSVMSCVSKGLGAPIGSVLGGSRDFIDQARYERGALGGQMRQAGIIAAAGIVALKTMVERLMEDHLRAQILAQAVQKRFPGSMGDFEVPQTNIVAFNHSNVDGLSAQLKGFGILANPIGPERMRLVTHKDLTDDDIAYAVRVIVDLEDLVG